MSIEVGWGDEAKTILRMTCPATWDMEDFRLSMRVACASVRAVMHPVYVIADLRASREIPQGITWGLYDFSRDLPPNWTAAIIITPGLEANSLTDMIAGLHRQLTGRKISAVKTDTDAYELVERLKCCPPGK